MFILGTEGGSTVVDKVVDGDGPEGVTDIAVVGVVLNDARFIVTVNSTKVSVKPCHEVFHEDCDNVMVEETILDL